MVSLARMIRPAAFLLAAAVLSSPALAEGPLGTLPTGRYLCELPGDAAGPPSLPVADSWFDIINASSYVSEGGSGTYLLTGDDVVFTRGPLRGAKFERTSLRALKRIDSGSPHAKLRCVRTGNTQ